MTFTEREPEDDAMRSSIVTCTLGAEIEGQAF